MAKNGKTKTTIAIIGLVLTIAFIFAGVIATGSSVKDTAEHAKEAVIVLKKDGCDPARDVDKRCLVIETKMESMLTSQAEIKTGQIAIIDGQQEILERLPE